MFCGTLNFMAPEIIMQIPNVDRKKADIWSFGVVIYHILCGQLPFKGSD